MGDAGTACVGIHIAKGCFFRRGLNPDVEANPCVRIKVESRSSNNIKIVFDFLVVVGIVTLWRKLLFLCMAGEIEVGSKARADRFVYC